MPVWRSWPKLINNGRQSLQPPRIAARIQKGRGSNILEADNYFNKLSEVKIVYSWLKTYTTAISGGFVLLTYLSKSNMTTV